MTTPTAPERFTEEQVEAMLKQLSRHFREPVMPMNRYCEGLQTWATCINERATHLRNELFPNLWETDPESKTHAYTERAKLQQAEYEDSKKSSLYAKGIKPSERDYQLDHLRGYESAAESANYTFLQIRKSNLLARLLYEGETLRKQRCPEHKGKWSGIEGGPDSVCPHKCQLTGWIQEEVDMGKPLPGVMAVQMVPTGQAPGDVTMIRSVDGELLGKAVVREMNSPKWLDGVTCRNVCDEPSELEGPLKVCCLDVAHLTPHRDDRGYEWPKKPDEPV